MFITYEDYKVVIGDSALRVVTQVSEENRLNAEKEAIEEVASYLRPKYDTNAIFVPTTPASTAPGTSPASTAPGGSAAGNDPRNRLVVMYTCDIALYHMAASLPQKMGMEIRKERYERAVKWLEGVQAGKIVPDLPVATDENGEPTGFLFKYSSQPKQKNNW